MVDRVLRCTEVSHTELQTESPSYTHHIVSLRRMSTTIHETFHTHTTSSYVLQLTDLSYIQNSISAFHLHLRNL